MNTYAFLCGSAPEDYRQKKLIQMQDFLTCGSERSLPEKNVVIFPNGVDEFLLGYGLENVITGRAGNKADEIFIYICTERPVSENDDTLWLRGSQIHKNFLSKMLTAANETGIGTQVVYDSCCDFVSEDDLGYVGA